MELSKLSTEELLALKSGDLSKLSTESLQAMRATSAQETPQRSASYQQGRRLPGAAQGLASAMQGPTFGFFDEIGGALAGARNFVGGGSFRDAYRETRDKLRGAADAQQEENPIATTATRMAAAAPTMLIGGAPRATATLGQTTARAMGVGAATGGLGGVGASEAETVPGMMLDGASAAALSAALAGAGNVAARGMGSVYENAASRASDTAAARKLRQITGGESAASKFAKQKVAEALVRDGRGDVGQTNPAAALGQASAKLSQLGPEGRLVDASGENTRALLDTLAILPGQTKGAVTDAIRARQVGRADRMIGAAERSLGTNGDRAADVVADLITTRSQAATPLYGRLHQMGVQADPELASLLNAAETLGAGKVARDIATAQRLPYSLSADQWNANAGNLSMRDLDHLKQGLDQLIVKQTKPDGSLTPLGFRLQGLQRDLLAKLDDATQGFYKQARDAFSGPSALIGAVDRGRRFLTQDDAATRAAMSDLSASEQEAFRLGAFEALRNKLGRPGGQTEVLGMWKDKILREKLQTIFPTERAFREFAARASAEGRMKGLESVGRGSQTAQRQFAAGDLDVPAVADFMQMASGAGGVPGFLTGVARQWNRVQTPEPVRDQMGRLLLSQGPQARNALMEVDAAARAVAASRQAQARGLGVLSGQSTNALLLPFLAP